MSEILDYNLKNLSGLSSSETKELVEDVSTLKEEVESNTADIENVQTELEEVDKRLNNLERTTAVRFEVERKILDTDGNVLSTTEWTRLYDNVGKTATATKDGSEVDNDFDNLPIYRDIKTVEYDKDNDKIVHYIDDDEFDWNSDYDKMTILPDMYLAHYLVTKDDGTYERYGVATQMFEHYKFFEGRMLARYEGCVVDNKLRSLSGQIPQYSKTIVNFRTYARNNGDTYEIQDIWSRFMLQCLYLVEYANSNSQSTLGAGIQSYTTATALIAESSVNRIIVSSAGTGLAIGRIISIGTSGIWNGSVAKDRTITAIEDYSDDDGVTGKAIYFDGATVTTAVGNVIWNSAQLTGACDSLGMKSGCTANNNYTSVAYRGIENPFAHMWEWIDGVNWKASDGAYVCRNHSSYASNVFDGDYERIGYDVIMASGWALEMGYDEANPEVALPIVLGASASTGYCDYFDNANNASNRVAVAGGSFSVGANCGFFYWNFNSGSGDNGWHIGARLLKYQE